MGAMGRVATNEHQSNTGLPRQGYPAKQACQGCLCTTQTLKIDLHVGRQVQTQANLQMVCFLLNERFSGVLAIAETENSLGTPRNIFGQT